MSFALSIDPGLSKGLGCALLDDHKYGALRAAAMIPGIPGNTLEAYAQTAHRAADWVGRVLMKGSAVTAVIVEWPVVYPDNRDVDPKWLIDLASINSFVCALFPGARLKRYLPREWKGTGKASKGTNKEKLDDPTRRRIEKRLTPAEIATVAWPIESLRDNVWEAIGVGLKYVGRFERERVIAR